MNNDAERHALRVGLLLDTLAAIPEVEMLRVELDRRAPVNHPWRITTTLRGADAIAIVATTTATDLDHALALLGDKVREVIEHWVHTGNMQPRLSLTPPQEATVRAPGYL